MKGLWPNEESLRREILEKRLNPDDFDLRLHLSAVLESNAGSDKDLDLKITKLLARQNHFAKIDNENDQEVQLKYG